MHDLLCRERTARVPMMSRFAGCGTSCFRSAEAEPRRKARYHQLISAGQESGLASAGAALICG
jgi:hypothetical protein